MNEVLFCENRITWNWLVVHLNAKAPAQTI